MTWRRRLGVMVFVTACAAGSLLTPFSAGNAHTTPTHVGVATELHPLNNWGGLDRVSSIDYTTADAAGHPVTAQGVVRLPAGRAPRSGWPVIAWDHGTSGSGGRCGLVGNATQASANSPVIKALTDAGYAVVAPSYLGLSARSTSAHPYLNTATEASATIDAVRAARRAIPTLSREWAVFGASQGGHAALATGHQAVGYAPELDFRGTVALAPASNTERIFLLARPGIPAVPGLPVAPLLAALAGIRSGDPSAQVDSYLTVAGRRLLDRISTACVGEWPAIVAGASVGSLVTRPLDSGPLPAAMRRYMAVPASGYQAPIMIVQGFRDTTVPLPLTLLLMDQFNRAGTQYRLHVVDSDHRDVGDRGGMDYALSFFGHVLPARR